MLVSEKFEIVTTNNKHNDFRPIEIFSIHENETVTGRSLAGREWQLEVPVSGNSSFESYSTAAYYPEAGFKLMFETFFLIVYRL